MNKLTFLLLAAGLLLMSCTRSTTRVVDVRSTKPQVSKTLQEKPSVRSLKRLVAIARFSNETKYGKGFFTQYDANNDPIGKQASDILAARLTETEKFIMLERTDMDKIQQEMQLGNLGQLNVGADYLIVGSVSEFGRKTTSNVGVFSRSKKQTAYAKVNVRLVDVRSGQIIYAEEGEGEAFSEAGTTLGVGDNAGYDSALNDKVISAAISSLVNNLIENLLDKPWRSYVLSEDGGNYIISGGKSQGIAVGDVFAVFQRGKQVKNPQTNLMIELPGSKIGELRVISLLGSTDQDEVSVCSLVSGSLSAGDFNMLYIEELK